MKKIISIILIFGVLFSFCGCSLFEKSYSIVYDIYEEVQNLDPQTAYKSSEQLVLCNIFEGLFDYDAEGNVVGAIAESYEMTENGTRYTIKLREDAKWENGDSVKAQDFVYALRRLIVYSEAAPRYMAIKNASMVNSGEGNPANLGVKAKSDFVLEINLEFPKKDFINLLTETYTYPCQEKFFRETKGKYGLNKKAVLSNGAFRLSEWSNETEKLSIIKNELYHDKASVLPTWVNFYQSTPEESVTRLKDGIINGALINAEGYALLKESGFDYEPVERITYGVAINPKENSPFSNLKIRKAIAAAFDRTEAGTVTGGSFKTATALIPHSVVLSDNSNYRQKAGERLTPYNDRVKAYASYKEGLSELEIGSIDGMNLLISEDMPKEVADYFSSVSQIIQRDLGLFINVETVDEQTYEKRVKSNDFDLAILKMESAANSIDEFIVKFAGTETSLYKNEELFAVYQQTVNAHDSEEAFSGYFALEKQIIEDGIFIPMLYGNDYFVQGEKTTGLYYNQSGKIKMKSAALS